MKNLLIPVLLSALVLPGAGQMFNREKIKGVALMVLFLALSVALCVLVVFAVLPHIPRDGSTMSYLEVQALGTRVMVEKGRSIEATWWAMITVWAFGILDAFLGARARARANAPKK
ncbi:MAG: hypothetical protein IPO76_04450 [Elusimicrobia bacterium]|jgi:hypothetical protein|nr:hypothetical protein [Elusimicrobiota bacterium]MBK7206801.1 hypothetical protein [Elusimicrobiota bacterium]MBK7545599.1 hypothetical protein [Elusimicrobiota bacterium]MBK7575211.1 hypothetical protein [Elusimicrobiota bacterium]MBK7687852.1 hypothetical protein [Elusimicrobiota bacterium]